MTTCLTPARWPTPRGLRFISAMVLLCSLTCVAQVNSATAASEAKDKPRPKVGLVLSGGGARGLAHVGVLKVLERERIPVDVIAGTSMGAIIGGLYASGMSATEMETALLKVDWNAIFNSRVDRPLLSQRRKDEDFELSPVLELGMDTKGEFKLPLGTLSSQGLEGLLRRYTMPVRHVRQFDDLSIPFRAVATDMETGKQIVMKDGDLAQALRSSMSVPGVFAPTDVNDRVLGDGGLVNNLPIDVARAMGADVVIAVNIGTPLLPRSALGSLSGVSAQMINILTEQNVQRALAQLHPQRDILIAPELGELTAADFVKVAEFIEIGERHLQTVDPRLQALAVSPAQWQAWQSQRLPTAHAMPSITSVAFEGPNLSHPERSAQALRTQPGTTFSIDAAEQDVRFLAASGDYMRSDYRLVDTDKGTGLIFQLEEKPWGPNYFRVGLDLATDFQGAGEFNIKISHTRRWLNRQGAEWRNALQIGEAPRLVTEWYQPFKLNTFIGDDWFINPYAGIDRYQQIIYNNSAVNDDIQELGRVRRTHGQFGLNLGQDFGAWGEWRLGWQHARVSSRPLIFTGVATPLPSIQVDEDGWRLKGVIDRLDYATFSSDGFRVDASYFDGRRKVLNSDLSSRIRRLDVDALGAWTVGKNTLQLSAHVGGADRNNSLLPAGNYNLGGFHQLSGYRANQLSGEAVFLAKAIAYTRLSQQPILTRGFFAGFSVEAGNTFKQYQDINLSQLRSGFSLFLGADTGIGPLYLGITHAPKGETGLILRLGRP